MNCRHCGTRIPSEYLRKSTFKCPGCGKVYHAKAPVTGSAPIEPKRGMNPARKQEKPKWKAFLTKKVWKLPMWAVLLLGVFFVGIIGSPNNDQKTLPTTQVLPATTEIPILRTVLVTDPPLQIKETAVPVPTAAITPEPVLRSGDRGAYVSSLQSRLIELGYLAGSADGIYGKGTENAVRAFQAAVGLPQTGICDYETGTKLSANTAPAAPKKASQQAGGSIAYIGNTNTGKFHYSGCSEVKKIKEGHKDYLSSRDEAVKKGYDPCKRCNP